MTYQELIKQIGKVDAEQVVSILAAQDPSDEPVMMDEGLFAFMDDGGTDKTAGHNAWIAYLPSSDRAAIVYNGDPFWYDAYSLENAITIAEEG